MRARRGGALAAVVLVAVATGAAAAGAPGWTPAEKQAAVAGCSLANDEATIANVAQRGGKTFPEAQRDVEARPELVARLRLEIGGLCSCLIDRTAQNVPLAEFGGRGVAEMQRVFQSGECPLPFGMQGR